MMKSFVFRLQFVLIVLLEGPSLAFVFPRARLTGLSLDSLSFQLRRRRSNPSSCAWLEASSTGEATSGSQNDSLVKAYTISSVLNGIIALLLLFIKDKTEGVKLSTKIGGAAGFGLAAGISNILRGAAQHDRLTSDTYKRLNIGLIGFSTFGLVALPGEAGFVTRASSCLILSIITSVVRGFGATIALEGWRKGCSSSSLWKELLGGAKRSFRGLFRCKLRGPAYRNPLVILLLGLVSTFLEGIFYLRNGMPVFDTSLYWSAVGRLFLVSTMLYSLKDAAERERLTGTTFIQMNYMLFGWLFSVGMSQGIAAGDFALGKAIMLPLSLPFLYEAIRYQLEKRGKLPTSNLTRKGEPRV